MNNPYTEHTRIILRCYLLLTEIFEVMLACVIPKPVIFTAYHSISQKDLPVLASTIHIVKLE